MVVQGRGGRSDDDDNDGEKARGRKSSSPCGEGAQMAVASQRLPPVLPTVLPLEDDSNLAGMTMALASMSGKRSPPHVFAEATLAEAEAFSPSASSLVVTLVRGGGEVSTTITTAATAEGPGSDPPLWIGWDEEEGVESSSPRSTVEGGEEAGGAAAIAAVADAAVVSSPVVDAPSSSRSPSAVAASSAETLTPPLSPSEEDMDHSKHRQRPLRISHFSSAGSAEVAAPSAAKAAPSRILMPPRSPQCGGVASPTESKFLVERQHHRGLQMRGSRTLRTTTDSDDDDDDDDVLEWKKEEEGVQQRGRQEEDQSSPSKPAMMASVCARPLASVSSNPDRGGMPEDEDIKEMRLKMSGSDLLELSGLSAEFDTLFSNNNRQQQQVGGLGGGSGNVGGSRGERGGGKRYPTLDRYESSTCGGGTVIAVRDKYARKQSPSSCDGRGEVKYDGEATAGDGTGLIPRRQSSSSPADKVASLLRKRGHYTHGASTGSFFCDGMGTEEEDEKGTSDLDNMCSSIATSLDDDDDTPVVDIPSVAPFNRKARQERRARLQSRVLRRQAKAARWAKARIVAKAASARGTTGSADWCQRRRHERGGGRFWSAAADGSLSPPLSNEDRYTSSFEGRLGDDGNATAACGGIVPVSNCGVNVARGAGVVMYIGKRVDRVISDLDLFGSSGNGSGLSSHSSSSKRQCQSLDHPSEPSPRRGVISKSPRRGVTISKLSSRGVTSKSPRVRVTSKSLQGGVTSKSDGVRVISKSPQRGVTSKSPRVRVTSKLPRGGVTSKSPQVRAMSTSPQRGVTSKLLRGGVTSKSPWGGVTSKLTPSAVAPSSSTRATGKKKTYDNIRICVPPDEEEEDEEKGNRYKVVKGKEEKKKRNSPSSSPREGKGRGYIEEDRGAQTDIEARESVSSQRIAINKHGRKRDACGTADDGEAGPGDTVTNCCSFKDGDDSVSVARLSRSVRFGRRGATPAPDPSSIRSNAIRIHVYDLVKKDVYVEVLSWMPWSLGRGCDFPLGRCFRASNSMLHAIGTGAYHVGLEVNGVEFAYGANDVPGLSGVFTCPPKRSSGYEYRCTLDLGRRRTVHKSCIRVPKKGCRIKDVALAASLSTVKLTLKDSSRSLPKNTGTSPPNRNRHSPIVSGVPYDRREVETFVEGITVMRQMAIEYFGTDYDLLRRNCCTFVQDACLRLGVPGDEIPDWFMNMADAGAKAEDAAKKAEIVLGKAEEEMRKMLPCGKGSVNNLPLLCCEGQVTAGESVLGLSPRSSSSYECCEVHALDGFEVIAQKKGGSKTEMEIVNVVEAATGGTNDFDAIEVIRTKPNSKLNKKQAKMKKDINGDNLGVVSIRETLSWTY